MGWFDAITLVLISGGAMIMVACILRVRRILAAADDKRTRRSWAFLRLLMVHFLLGYVAALVLVLARQVHYLPSVVGFVFFFGAVFVCLAQRVCLSSIRQEKLLAQKALAGAEEMKRLTEITCHHLQEPLRQVASFLQLVARRCQDRTDRELRDWVDIAVDGAVWMKHLLSDLSEYEQLATAALRRDMVQPEQCLQLALTFLHTKVEALGAQVSAGRLPPVCVDKNQFTRLLQDLVGNALKFHADAPPVVSIEAVQRGPVWFFTVRDNGIGIEERFHSRIFRPFEKLHPRARYVGTGIGLAVCRKIVANHGGEIGVESRPGKGSAFWFTIPVDGPPQRHALGRLQGGSRRRVPRKAASPVPAHGVAPPVVGPGAP